MSRPSAVLLHAWFGVCLALHGAGAGWEVVPSGTQDTLFKAFFLDSRSGFIVGSHGALLATKDGGKSWARRDLPYREDLRSVWFTDARTGFACGSGGLILRSADSGRTWEKLPTPTAGLLNDIAFPDPGTGYAAGDADSLLVSRDSGATWSVQPLSPLPEGRNLYKTLDFPTASDGYLVTATTLYKTRDAGRTWAKTGFPEGSAYLYEAWFFDADTGFIADVNFGGLLKTTDGMQTYRNVLMSSVHRVHFLGRKIGYAWGAKCYRTGDGGEHWERDSTFDPGRSGNFRVRDLASAGAEAILAVGDNGMIARKEEVPGVATALAGTRPTGAVPPARRAAYLADGRRDPGGLSRTTPSVRLRK